MSDADQLNALERAQRTAYWKGEETAARRLPAFLPQDPVQGAVLAESERIEEQVWNLEQEAAEAQYLRDEADWQMDVEAQNMPGGTPTYNKTPESQQEMARMALWRIKEAGGELSPKALDQWVEFQGREQPEIFDRPSYEQKGMFYSWMRDMEDISEGREPRDIELQSPEEQRPRDTKSFDKMELEQGKRPQPRDLDVDISGNNLPDTIGVG